LDNLRRRSRLFRHTSALDLAKTLPTTLRRFSRTSGAESGDGDAVPGAILTATKLGARYGASRVLWNVDLHVLPGEIVTLLGANGAGKTTFLHTVMGLVQMTSGRVFHGEVDISRQTPEARVTGGIALCPEGRRIFTKMTVEENLRLGAGLKHQHGYDENVQYVFELFPALRPLNAKMAGLLSGGEQQMLAVGRALMGRPRLLLLDEPSLGLAPMIVTVIFGLIERLREEGVTILLVEQNVRMALQIADRGYVVNTGRIEVSGTADELRESASVEEAYLGLAVHV